MTKFSISTLLVAIVAAVGVLSAPTESFPSSGLHVRDDFDQGDGFYVAILDEVTGGTDVQFTPIAEIIDTANAPAAKAPAAKTPTEEVTPADSGNLFKRASTCTGLFSNRDGDLVNAITRLASNADTQGFYAAGTYGWFDFGEETAYFCNYGDNYLTYDLIVDLQTAVDNYCGQDGYGYDHETNVGGATDIVVGRTWRGDTFC